MKLIEIAERTWALDREEIIKRKCPTDLGERYRKYENTQKPECDQPGACEYCWEQEEGCEYIKTCPSASGWCIIQNPSADCVGFLQTAYRRYADLGLTPEQIQRVDDLYRGKCEEVVELRRRLREQEEKMGKHIRRDKQQEPTKAAKDESRSEARRSGDHIPKNNRTGSQDKDRGEEVYIHKKYPYHHLLQDDRGFFESFGSVELLQRMRKDIEE